jgi:hypothetical protein
MESANRGIEEALYYVSALDFSCSNLGAPHPTVANNDNLNMPTCSRP